jgi:hypothetical protein
MLIFSLVLLIYISGNDSSDANAKQRVSFLRVRPIVSDLRRRDR